MGVGFFAGLLGSCITAGRSAAQRHADGYEFEDGFQYPSAEKDTERFNIRMLGFFYLRPFLGAGMGVVAYAGTVAGTLFSTASDGAPRAESVLFFALLAGLFSKTLILKLQKGFDALVG